LIILHELKDQIKDRFLLNDQEYMPTGE